MMDHSFIREYPAPIDKFSPAEELEHEQRQAWEEEHLCTRCNGFGIEPPNSEPGICSECRGIGFDKEIPLGDSIQDPS